MPAESSSNKILVEDAIFILQCLRENQRTGRSTHLMDVRADIADSVTLDFSDYLRFFRRFGYVEVDRETHSVSVTAAGEAAAERSGTDREFAAQLRAYFGGASEGTAPTPAPQPRQVPAGTEPVHEELVYLRGQMIGEGPVGTVHRGVHGALGLNVAVKEVSVSGRLSAALFDQLRLELSRQAQLRHPAVLAVHDLDLTVPQPFAVFEFCEGGNLRRRLSENALVATDATRALVQLLSALAAAHVEGFTHHDLKPENVLFDRRGNVRVADFGFGRVLACGAGERSQVVGEGAAPYLAPELLRADRDESDPRADVYAAGILFYEMLFGQPPGRQVRAPSEVPGIPREVDQLFERMIADRPADRPKDAEEALDQLLQLLPAAFFRAPGTIPVLASRIER